jgi:hypothetical protein
MSASLRTKKPEALKHVGMVLFRKTPAFLFMATLLAISGVGLPNLANANPYFNSASENCNVSTGNCAAHPTWVLADDFNNGNWYATGNQPTVAANDGWLGCNDSGPNNSCRNPPPPAVTANGSGLGGSGFAAMSSLQGGDGGDGALAMHGFYPNNATYNELWIRMYIKFLPGYVFNNNQKFFSLIRSAYAGGIDYGGIGRALNEMHACPYWTCNVLGEGFLEQNQGNNLFMTPGSNWYYMEFHVKLNTYNTRNGTFELWINNCGTTGVCSGSPTLRSRYTTVGWKGGGGFDGPIGSMWFDIWGNPSDVGTIHIDNLVVSTSGPIGFIGGPPVPQNLKVQ